MLFCSRAMSPEIAHWVAKENGAEEYPNTTHYEYSGNEMAKTFDWTPGKYPLVKSQKWEFAYD